MQFENVTCPHCGLLCDDLIVEVNDSGIALSNPTNSICKQAFDDAAVDYSAPHSPTIKGKRVTEEQALEKAAGLLQNAKMPLVNGLIADIQACREAIALTEKLGGVIDHANGYAMRKSTAVMQRMGEVRTTLAEVRNRADCIVIFGKQTLDKFPRFLQRILKPEKTIGDDNCVRKKIFILDICDDGNTRCVTDENITYLFLNFPLLESLVYRFQEIVTRPKEYFDEIDIETKQLFTMLETIKSSQYTSFSWSIGNFNPESAEHTVQALTETIKLLMKKIRCVALPLSGSHAEITANHVCTWQTGVPLPVSFIQGTPVHNPVIHDGMKMILNHETDCLLWIATYNSNDAPPSKEIPTILVGHPKMDHSHAEVYFPTGIPGIDHRGLACRTDSVATLPLQKLRDYKLYSASEWLIKISQQL